MTARWGKQSIRNAILGNLPNSVYTLGMTIDASQLDPLAARYSRFAAESDEISPLYAFLATKIAKNQELLTIALACRPEQPPGNLFLDAVHYLLLQQPNHPLTRLSFCFRKNLGFMRIGLQHTCVNADCSEF